MKISWERKEPLRWNNFIIFKEFLFKQIKQFFLEDEGPTFSQMDLHLSMRQMTIVDFFKKATECVVILNYLTHFRAIVHFEKII